MNRLRLYESRRRFSRPLLGAALCAAACTANNLEQTDGGDAAPVDVADSQPSDASLRDQAPPPPEGAPLEASPEGSSSGTDSSSGGGSSSSSSSGGGSTEGGSSGADSSPDAGGSADATIDVAGDSSPEATADVGGDSSSCAKGTVTPDQVVMLGDSYLDPLFSATGTDIVADAQNAGALPSNMTYRHYYAGGAALNVGTPGPLYIPFQYEMLALMDPTVSNPTNIDTVIIDGGAGDFILGDRTCLLLPPAFDDGGVRNASCYSTVQGAMNRLAMLMQEMAQKGVKHIVYFFYPHLDPNGGGLLTTPAPAVNDTIDYAAALAQQVCETVPQCLFVDPRASFEGQIAQYISGDHFNPSAAGAQVLADLVWQTMADHCIAQ
jgi:lysophospholipase L1-like esterase